MAKKKVAKKISKNGKTTVKAETSAGLELLIVLTVILCTVLGILYFTKSGPFESSIKKGQCYLNKAYEPVIVTGAYSSWDEVELRYMKVKESSIFQGWYLSTDYSRSSVSRTFSFVKDNYTLIKCASYDN